MSKAIYSLLIIGLAGCSNAKIAGFNALSQRHHIKQYSCGQVIGEWWSTGKIENEEHSDGYYFQDEKTQKLVMVSGTVQITLD